MNAAREQHLHRNISKDRIGYWELFVSSKELNQFRRVGERDEEGMFRGLEISSSRSSHRYPVVEDGNLVFRDLPTVSIRLHVTRAQLESSGVENEDTDSPADWQSKSVFIRPQRQKVVIDSGKKLLARVGRRFSCVFPLVKFRRFSSSTSSSTLAQSR